MRGLLGRLSLSQQFILISLVILTTSGLGLGWWVGDQIELGVINRTARDAALYVDTFIDPPLQELTQGESLTPDHIEVLNHLVQETPLGQHIVAFKIWDTRGRILYSTNPALIGQVFPLKEELVRAARGQVVSDISDLKDAENWLEQSRWPRLLETYSPINKGDTGELIGVVEFYQTVDALEAETRKAQMNSWLLFGGAMLVTFLLLSLFVRRASDTIQRQQTELNAQVTKLTELLAQNEELNARVRRAVSHGTAHNERFLRRISAELHDGPAQDLGYSLMRLDGVLAHVELCEVIMPDGRSGRDELQAIESSLQHALQEIRAVSSGLGLPELTELTLNETLKRAIRTHERRTGTQVTVKVDGLPDHASLLAKITLYRLVQEALNNAYRYGGGAGQQVVAHCVQDELTVAILDEGPGFDVRHIDHGDEHLGLAGMRERVESQGGLFHIESGSQHGTRITARIPLQAAEDSYE